MPRPRLLPRIRLPRNTQQAARLNIFHVKYVSEGAVYLDAGRNGGLEEGMILHLVHADPNGGTTDRGEVSGARAHRRCAHFFSGGLILGCRNN